MPTRKISGLLWARPCPRPKVIPRAKAKTGTKAQGLGYEKKLVKVLPVGHHGQWFEFEDANGRGFCQPDYFFPHPGRIVVVEAKLSWTQAAVIQLEDLYSPILAKVYGLPVQNVVICKILRRDAPLPLLFPSLDLALAANLPLSLVHWLGSGPL